MQNEDPFSLRSCMMWSANWPDSYALALLWPRNTQRYVLDICFQQPICHLCLDCLVPHQSLTVALSISYDCPFRSRSRSRPFDCNVDSLLFWWVNQPLVTWPSQFAELSRVVWSCQEDAVVPSNTHSNIGQRLFALDIAELIARPLGRHMW